MAHQQKESRVIQDTINSIRLTLSERIGNPFISATLIASSILNWKLSLLLFSDVTYDAKIQKILDLYPDSVTRFDELFLYPICFGVFWTFIWPVITLGINAYWYWMKTITSNLKIKIERKKKLSEAEAAELYSTIDAQESRYLDFLKERQNRVDNLAERVSNLDKENQDFQLEISKQKTESEKLKSEQSGMQSQLSSAQNELGRVRKENDNYRRSLDEITNRALEFAEHLPGLKTITNALTKADNHRADELWLREEFCRQEPSLLSEDTQTQQKMFSFYLALNLIQRESSSYIVFGEPYRYAKDKVLGTNNNSPEIVNLT